MRRFFHFVGLVLIAVTASCERSTPPAPTLIIALPVDQLRADLLERYDSLFTGGLRRILDEGLIHTNATHDHAATYTAVGHTTLGTGVYPTRHQIVGNSWSERLPDGEWRSVYAVEDTLATILGFPGYPGRSPANIAHDGLADWVLANHPDARIAAVSGKDRASIPMSGTARGEVYWFLAEQGAFVTSSWYRDELPDWVVRFNEERMPVLFGDTIWESTVPPEFEALALPDFAEWESRGGEFSTFPHLASVEAEGDDDLRLRYNRWRYDSPFQGPPIFAFAEELIERLELGQRAPVVDYLVVGVSQTDYVGHRYGPLSLEQLDNLLRVDRELGAFLDYLDRVVGEGQWVLGLSADHGVADAPDVSSDPNHVRLSSRDRARIRAVAADAAEASDDPDPEARADRVAAALETVPEIVHALPLHRIAAGPLGDTLLDLFRNSYSADRYTGMFIDYDVMAVFQEGMLQNRSYGSTHGTPWLYDRSVPLIFVGAGVRPGRSAERVATVDLAPTLAALAGVPVPADLDGRAVVGTPARAGGR